MIIIVYLNILRWYTTLHEVWLLGNTNGQGTNLVASHKCKEDGTVYRTLWYGEVSPTSSNAGGFIRDYAHLNLAMAPGMVHDHGASGPMFVLLPFGPCTPVSERAPRDNMKPEPEVAKNVFGNSKDDSDAKLDKVREGR